MKVSEAPNCVAYHLKQNWHRIAGPIDNKDPRFSFEKIKSYVIHLAYKAQKTKKRQEIIERIKATTTPQELRDVVENIIKVADETEYIDYYNYYSSNF